MFKKYQNILLKENEKKLYLQKITKHFPRSKSQSKIFNKTKTKFYRNNFLFSTNKKAKSHREENSEKRNIRPSLMDEDYEYDEDEMNQNILNNQQLKKKKTSNYFAFFNLDKNRADIYKKMNDLRKLQMAYFGRQFLKNKNQSEKEMFEGVENIVAKFFNTYQLKQNQETEEKNKKKKGNNFKKKLVEKISANKKLRDKTSFGIIKKRNVLLKKESKSDISYNKIKGKTAKNFFKFKINKQKKIKSKSYIEDKNLNFIKYKDKPMSKSTRNFRITKNKI